MAIRILTLAAFLFVVTAARSAEPPPAQLHLTGNATVDFFGSSTHLTGDPMIFPNAMQGEAGASIGGEKSPWLASALSLAVPGAGELYAESYVKAAVFFAVEATSWIVAYSYNKKGNQQTDDYHLYANQHWRASKYVNWTLRNLHTLNPNDPITADQYGQRIYPEGYDAGEPPDYDPPFREMNWTEMNVMEDAIRQYSNNGFSHQLPSWGDQQYYELIGKYAQFRSGWDDDGSPDPIDLGDLPVSLPPGGHMITYRDMRAKANDYYDVASTFVSVAVINHVVSALDAFWSVTRYNKSLHAEVRMRVQPTRFGAVPLTEMKLSYTF